MPGNNWPIEGTSRDKLYQVLGLESLGDRRWYKKLAFFYKTISNLPPTHLTAHLSRNTPPCLYNTRIQFQNTFRNILC